MREEMKIDDFKKYVLSLVKAKIVPWDYDVKSGVIFNVFGLEVVFNENIPQLLLADWIRLVLPEDRERVVKAFNSVLNNESEEFNVDYRINAGENNCTWIRATGRVSERDKEGKPLLVTGTNLDISELKLVHEKSVLREQQLRDSERRLKKVMKLGKMSPWEYDFNSDSFVTDRQMSVIWGYEDLYDSGKPLSRHNLYKKIHPDDREYVSRKFMDAVNKGENLDISYRIVSGDGVKHINFVSEVQHDDKHMPVKLIGVAQDITGIKQLETCFAKQLEGLRFIADKIGLGLWEMGTESGYISFLNFRSGMKEEERYNNISIDELMERVHPEDIPQLKSRIDAHLSGCESVIETETRIEKDGQYKWFHISSVVNEADEGGKPLSIRGFYQDITERKDMESKLYHSQKMEAIGRLAGGVAHDFNNILQVVLGYGSLALMEADNDTELFQNISHIVDSAERAKTLVRQLLLFARKEKFNPTLIFPNELINGLASMLRRLIGENITLDFIPQENVPPVYGDAGQLEQVFLNLCINARDAISGTGRIVISIKEITLDDYWPCFDNRIPAGSYIQTSVSDTGCGIDPGEADHIFEPFFTTKEKNSGTGLGLATVYSIVKQHNGYIDVHSLKGKGSTFTVYFPVAESLPEEAGLSDDRICPVRKFTGKGNIILAEDDELVRKYTARILSDSGYSVIPAADGGEAVSVFNENKGRVDLIILDVVMPKINGWDVYNRIGGDELDIPVIFFSGYDRNLLPPAIASKPNMRFVQKPFKYYAIIKAVHELLD